MKTKSVKVYTMKNVMNECIFSGLFAAYLIKINDVRDYILDDIYGIPPCVVYPLESIIDTCFEYSILSNLLLVIKNLVFKKQLD